MTNDKKLVFKILDDYLQYLKSDAKIHYGACEKSCFRVIYWLMEFAVIKTGGKQYKVSKGDTLKVEKLIGTYNEGDKIVFDKVLLVDNGKDTTIGMPFIDGASVEATLVKSAKRPTVTVIHYKQKSRYFKKNGHRQPYFEVKIDAIK